MYFIGFTILGGIIAIFVVAGWNSYNEGKLPEVQTMFRWFLAGITAAGISSYVWLFGTGGDPSKLFNKVSQALEVNEIIDSLKAPAGGASVIAEVKEIPVEKPIEMTVGMPTF